MDLITYALCKKNGGESITYTLTADTENKTIVLTPSEGTAQVITVPYATDASTVNGHEVPELENGKIPANFLPSFVDNVDEYDNISLFPVVGESNRIYIDKSTNKTYRWSGTAYVEISESIALGETSSTAYRGDRGKIAYDHSQSAHAPSNAEANQNAFSNVKIDSDIINASAKTDTLEFIAGDNIILTPNVSNKKITVSQVPVRKTASGDIASFSDGTGDPFLEVKANINPVQDLHGYDNPWAGGAGRNLFNMGGKVTATHAGLTITSDDDYLIVNGTKYGGSYFTPSDLSFTLPSGTYYAKAFSLGTTTGAEPSAYVMNGDTDISGNFFTEKSFTLSEETTLLIRFALWTDGAVYTNYKIGVVISKTANIGKFYPYSNICPISGFTGVNVTVTDDLTTPTETHILSIPFHDNSDNPITVYGGMLDVTSGELRVTYVSINLEDYASSILFNTGYNCWVLSVTPSALFKGNYDIPDILTSVGYIPRTFYYGQKGDNSIGVTNSGQLFVGNNSSTVKPTGQVVYPLATPQTYQLTPQQINTLLGQNNIFADCGQIEVAYKTPFYTDLTTKNEVQVLINESITSALNASY